MFAFANTGAHSRQSSYENGRWVDNAPTVFKPATAPVPLKTVPTEEQDIAVVPRFPPKDGSIEENESYVACCHLLPVFRNQMLVLPKSLEDLCIETDVVHGLEARELLLTLDAILTILEHVLEHDSGKVNLGQSKRAFVLFLDFPVVTYELGEVERLGAINLQKHTASSNTWMF